MLTVTVEHVKDTAILHCSGRIVRGNETAILCPVIQQYGRDIILDLSQIETMDAAGIGALISLQAAGIYLKLMDPTAPVRELLRLTGLESVFEITQPQSANHVVGECVA